MEHLVNWRGFSWTNFQTRAIELKLASFQKSLSGPTPKVGIEKKLDVKQLKQLKWPIIGFELHKNEPNKLELQKNEPRTS